MNLFLTGAGGLLGRAVADVAAHRGHDVTAADRAALDVTDPEAVRREIAAAAPEVVVHCAAFTDVDGAEAEPERALRVNGEGTGNVAAACRTVGSLLVYPSTDYVFAGNAERPWRTDDPAAPLGAYGRSKLAGEVAARARAPEHLVVRTSWLYGPGGRNFVDAVLARASRGEPLRVVADQTGRPTWTPSLARTLLELVEAGARGTVHATDGGSATWLELAKAALGGAGLEVPVVAVTSAEWGAAAPRPAYSVLDVGDTEALIGHPLPHWRSSLARHLETTGASR
ncbi:MAG TPA: dTDP-4-dehydrorhamnose reductase [Longimicrobiales bacterium]|nr:dTDP-4-dehydrorhamnose reductase [Longimicrobiales bacterium]